MSPRNLFGLDSPPAGARRIQAFLLGLYLVSSHTALAFKYPLEPEEVREAYSLGQSNNREELAGFLSQYQHDFKYPSDHPVAYVQSVEFQTPYEQIVLRTLRTTRYSKFQADEDYQKNPGLVLVRVVVALKINYGGPVPSAESFTVAVYQSKPIDPERITNTVTCDPYGVTAYPANSGCTVYTREILLRFDAGQFAPGNASIKVGLPGGQTVETKYNLDKLK